MSQWLLRNPLVLGCLMLAAWGCYERHEATKWQTQAIHCAAARLSDKQAADAAQARTKTTTHATAETNSAVYQANVAAIDAGAAGYRAAHRVRIDPAPVAAGENPVASVPIEPAIVPVMGVSLSDADFDTCNAWVKYGTGANDLFRRLIADGLAEPMTPDPKGTPWPALPSTPSQ